MEVLFIPSKFTGTISCSSMHKVDKQCQILEWKKDLLMQTTTRFCNKTKLSKDVSYINDHYKMVKYRWKANDFGNCRNGFFCWKGFHNLLSVLKDVECSDCTVGFGRKMLKHTIHSSSSRSASLLPLCSSSSSSLNTQRCWLSDVI